ncbi:MAG: cysteine--tRNA ligase [Thermoplasmatota archaeon]
MSLKLYNVRTRQKEAFQSLEPGKVGFYLCGLTVYDHAHIGHGRTAVSFEVIRRWLERSHDVTFVQNVTDVEDKIIARAAEKGVSPREHSAYWDDRCAQVMARLGVREADQTPHVTDSIEDIIAFIEAIISNGHAYATEAGNVYFDVPGYDEAAAASFPDCGYGSLSNRDFREMATGTRKQVESDKRHPADFALWKAAGDGEHPDANWESPWGSGRPGWHIECSLMSTRALGDRIDIHGGGQDLIFPHHENEIAQSQAKTGKAPFVGTWLHTGFLNVDGEKMSKSLGNFIVLEEMLDELDAAGIDAEALRFYFVQTHYRSKIDFSRKGLDEAAKAVGRLNRTRRRLAEAAASGRMGCADVDPALQTAASDLRASFEAAMDDDIATPTAIAALFTFQKAANQALETDLLGASAAAEALATFEDVGEVLTLFKGPAIAEAEHTEAGAPEALVSLAGDLGVAGEAEGELVEAILGLRQEARAAKDWGRADELRDALTGAGYVLEDKGGATSWMRADP